MLLVLKSKSVFHFEMYLLRQLTLNFIDMKTVQGQQRLQSMMQQTETKVL